MIFLYLILVCEIIKNDCYQRTKGAAMTDICQRSEYHEYRQPNVIKYT